MLRVLQFIVCASALAFDPFEDATEMDYLSSAHAVKNLAQVEQKLLKVLISYKKSLESKQETVNIYSDAVLNSTQNSKHGFLRVRNISIFNVDQFFTETSAHLFQSFRIIQRFAKVLPVVEADVKNYEPGKLFKKSIRELKRELKFPTNHDVDQSMISIFRLKQVYNLSAFDMLKGDFQGFSTNSGLSKNDILEFGSLGLRMGMFSVGFDFLETALKLANEESVLDLQLKARIEALLEQGIKKHDKRIKAGIYKHKVSPFHFGKELHGLHSESFRTKARNMIKPDFSSMTNYPGIQTAFERLCSGQELRKPSVIKRYNCRFQSFGESLGYFVPQPLKIEYLNADPPIALIHDVLSDVEISKLLKSAQPKLQRSKVAATDDKAVNFGRTSSNTWFPDYEPSNQFQFISRRVELITGLRVNFCRASEDLQVANYGPGGLYGPHYDVARNREELNDEALRLFKERGDRIATFMFYLSEIERGGGTVFPALGIGIMPVKGSAVFWYNLKNDGSFHERTLHGGCPVLLGSKWIANKWIRSDDQMFIRKCKPRISSFK